MRRWHTIIYKGGAKAHIKAKKLTVEWEDGRVTGLAWVDATPFPLYAGLADVAAVYQGKV